MSAFLQALEPLVSWLAPMVGRLTPLLTPLFGPGDLELGVPQALLLLPLPVLVWGLLPPYREAVESVRGWARRSRASPAPPRTGSFRRRARWPRG